MASPGRSWIVLFWMGRKWIVLLQLLPFSSPHRERPTLVLMGFSKYWDGLLSVLCGIRRCGSSWRTLTPPRSKEHLSYEALQSSFRPIPLLLNEEPEILKDWTSLSRSCSQFFPPRTEILCLLHYVLTTHVCTSVGRNIFNAGRISKNISSLAEQQVKKWAKKNRNSINRLWDTWQHYSIWVSKVGSPKRLSRSISPHVSEPFEPGTLFKAYSNCNMLWFCDSKFWLQK